MNAEEEHLVVTIDEMARLLRDAGHRSWADWLAKDVAWLRRGDAHGLTHFLSAFGGMGSLNDVLLAGPNQASFERLRADAYEVAANLNRTS
jgi:hypothetical protein